jgi:hypothetical protein
LVMAPGPLFVHLSGVGSNARAHPSGVWDSRLAR